jgi:hypothetical protein
MEETASGYIGMEGRAIGCSNPNCLGVSVSASIIPSNLFHNHGATDPQGRHFDQIIEPIFTRQIIPDSSAKPQPHYIPEGIREDYEEACKIRDLSRKGSATLARRCLQGMIRDFARIKEPNLYKEIEKLNELAKADDAPKGVSEDSIESLHHVRSLGNIGAHMERDIDLIIPVDPKEAQILIDLIEILFEEWYITREKRQSKFAALKATAEEKQALKELPKPTTED